MSVLCFLGGVSSAVKVEAEMPSRDTGTGKNTGRGATADTCLSVTGKGLAWSLGGT